MLEARSPSENTFNTCRIGCHDAYRREDDACLANIRIHPVEPVIGDLSRASPHIGEDHRRPISQFINKRIQTCWSVNIHLGRFIAKEMRQRSTRFVLRIEIQQLYWI